MVPTEIPEKDCSLLFLGVRPMYAQIYAFSRSIMRYWPDEGLWELLTHLGILQA